MFSLTKSIPNVSLYFSFHNCFLFSLVLEFSHSYNSLISLFCCFFHCSLPPYPNLNSAQQLLPFLQALTAKSHLPKTKKKVQQPRSRLPTRLLSTINRLISFIFLFFMRFCHVDTCSLVEIAISVRSPQSCFFIFRR